MGRLPSPCRTQPAALLPGYGLSDADYQWLTLLYFGTQTLR